ncbi:MAG TPA: hypothetical protein PLP92_02130, partial [Rhodocyclaceae bacterium]|nr:hypothetical protein [Rhodocyclaceae bacterium]
MTDAPRSPRSLRLFLSSPGDVADERQAVRRVLEDLALTPLLRTRVRFDLVAWDDPAAPVPLDATETPQLSVNRYKGLPRDCDLTVVILWSRLGTPLPSHVTRPDGSAYASGTVWELEDARTGRKPLWLYQRTATPQVDLDDPEFDAKRAQYHAVKAFIADFRAPDGSLSAGINTHADPAAFTILFRQHLEAHLGGLLFDAPPVAPDSPRIDHILLALDAQLAAKDSTIAERDGEIARLKAELDALRRSAIADTLTRAAASDATPAEQAAAQALEAGDSAPAEALLRADETALTPADRPPPPPNAAPPRTSPASRAPSSSATTPRAPSPPTSARPNTIRKTSGRGSTSATSTSPWAISRRPRRPTRAPKPTSPTASPLIPTIRILCATSPSATTRSATCSSPRVTARPPWRPIARASPSPRPSPAATRPTPNGSATSP